MSPDCAVRDVRGLVFVFALAALAWMTASHWLVQARGLGPLPQLLADMAFVVASALVLCAALSRELRAQRQRSRSAELLETLADHSPDAIFAKDLEGRYSLFNRGAARIAGRPAEAVLGLDDGALFPPAELEAIRERDAQVMRLDGPVTFEETLQTAVGQRIFHTIKGPLREARGKVVGLFGIARDVTHRVQERQALVRSEQRYRLAAAGGTVWDWDIESCSGYAQSSFWRRLGYEPPRDDEAVERLEVLMHPDDRDAWRNTLRSHLRQRAPYDLEFRARHSDGSWRWFHTQGQAMWNEQGRAVYMAGTTVDVTERREAEEALRRTRGELSQLLRRLMEQERATTQRLAQSLHDHLGQVLGSARLHLDLAQTQAQSHPAAAQRLSCVSSLLDSAIAEVRRVLVDLRPPLLQEQGLAAALDNELRRGAANGLATEVALDASAAPDTRWPDDVEHALFMIAREAVANALLHAGGSEVAVRLAGDANAIELQIEDDGRGIADAARHGRPGHLGLVSMRERAASIGATLTIDRRPDGGTAVILAWRA